MRGLIVVAVVAACSKHEPPSPKVEPVPAAAPVEPAPPPLPATPAGKLVDRTVCAARVPAASWLGTWNGARPFDEANPMFHRGPTQVTITAAGDKLHVSEGVGTAKLEEDIAFAPDGIIATGQDHKTRTLNAMSAETGKVSQITVDTDLSLAACFDAQQALHMWRVLDTSGTGIASQHEEDDVVLSK